MFSHARFARKCVTFNVTVTSDHYDMIDNTLFSQMTLKNKVLAATAGMLE